MSGQAAPGQAGSSGSSGGAAHAPAGSTVTGATGTHTGAGATPAAAVIGEAVVAFELANALLDKFGGDSVSELKRNVDSYREACKRW